MTDETITKNWMQQLGAEDGARLVADVLEQLDDADTQERVDRVSLRTLGAIGNLARGYRERGVSDPLVLAWRVACHEEMSRILRQHKQARQAEAA